MLSTVAASAAGSYIGNALSLPNPAPEASQSQYYHIVEFLKCMKKNGEALDLCRSKYDAMKDSFGMI